MRKRTLTRCHTVSLHQTSRPDRIAYDPSNTGISCEAVSASDRDGAGMKRHVHSGNHAAESFVCFIPLFDARRIW
jgi:hypothetical protein